MDTKDFQDCTAKRIFELFTKQNQERVLLADEVGLGKTIVAKKVIDLYGKWRKDNERIKDDHFVVVYICSNINIAQQNAEKLGITDTMDITQSRLSMQSWQIYSKSLQKHEYAQLIPLTPNTSFTMTSGCGTKEERAFMYACLRQLDELKCHDKKLRSYFKMSAGESWNTLPDDYTSPNRRDGFPTDEFYSVMKAKLKDKLCEDGNELLISRLKNYITHSEEVSYPETKRLVIRLRKLFAEISLDMLNPDLVVMDEFQRFRELLDKKDDEEHMLVNKFFDLKDNKNATRILLLSATPYEPYTTLEALNETNVDEGYKDFFRLMRFLNEGNKQNADFETVWKDFSEKLTKGNIAVLKVSKARAEDEMYHVMCRTERININNTDVTGVRPVDISKGDVLSYCQMERLLEACEQRDRQSGCRGFRSYHVPMDYVKSSPYLLSFMDHYDLKTHIMKTSFKDHTDEIFDVLTPKKQQVLLKYDWIWWYRDIPSNNARLDAIKKMLFSDSHSERLLWVPASYPYYSTHGSVFEKNKDFSKILVFSAWEMVPRMLSVMLSYEAERLTIGRNSKLHYALERHRTTPLNDDAERLFCYPSHWLASLYDPKDYFGQTANDIRKSINRKIREAILAKRVRMLDHLGSKSVLAFLQYMDGKLDDVAGIPSKAVGLLADMAIASPSVCMFRLLKYHAVDNVDDCCRRIAQRFVSLFNRRESQAVVDLESNKETYLMRVADYCVKGNLQSVLDEYAHMFNKQGDDLCAAMEDGFTETTPTFDIDMYTGKEKISKKPMRIHYAVSFANVKVTEKSINRSATVRTTFNSPFRPFVLASTSVGQEGLDFHWYARKMMHWNLPSNPVDMEQREGRINRYECLSIRRNVAHRYGGVWHTWQEMFDLASKEFKKSWSDLVPYWCLPPEMEQKMVADGQRYEKIERIVPLYPLSMDKGKYDRMERILALYRYTLGQPRQEELVRLLNDSYSEEELKELEINLCPFDKAMKADS